MKVKIVSIPAKANMQYIRPKALMHYLLSKLDITRHDGVKCHKLNVDQLVFRKQLLKLQKYNFLPQEFRIPTKKIEKEFPDFP